VGRDKVGGRGGRFVCTTLTTAHAKSSLIKIIVILFSSIMVRLPWLHAGHWQVTGSPHTHWLGPYSCGQGTVVPGDSSPPGSSSQHTHVPLARNLFRSNLKLRMAQCLRQRLNASSKAGILYVGFPHYVMEGGIQLEMFCSRTRCGHEMINQEERVEKGVVKFFLWCSRFV